MSHRSLRCYRVSKGKQARPAGKLECAGNVHEKAAQSECETDLWQVLESYCNYNQMCTSTCTLLHSLILGSGGP